MKNCKNVCKGNVVKKGVEKKYLSLITDTVIELLLDNDTLMFTVDGFIIDTITTKDMEDVVYYGEKFVSMTNCIKDLCIFEDNGKAVSLEEIFLINVLKDAFGLDTMIIHGADSNGFFHNAITSTKEDLLERIECFQDQLKTLTSEEVLLTIVRYLNQDVDMSLNHFYDSLKNVKDVKELRLGCNYMLKLDKTLLPKEAIEDNPTRVSISLLKDLEYMTPKKTFIIEDFGVADFFEIPVELQKFFDNKIAARDNFIDTVSGEYFSVYPYFYKKENYIKEEKVIFENVNKAINVFEEIVFCSPNNLKLKRDADTVISLSFEEIEGKMPGTDKFINALGASKPNVEAEKILKEIIDSLLK